MKHTQIIDIEDNEPVRTALSGKVKRIADFLTRNGVKTSARRLNHWVEPFKVEIGVQPPHKVRAVMFALKRFDAAAAEYLGRWLCTFPDEAKRAWKREDWLERVFSSIGQLQAYLVRGRWDKAHMERFELSELLRAEIV